MSNSSLFGYSSLNQIHGGAKVLNPKVQQLIDPNESVLFIYDFAKQLLNAFFSGLH